MYLREITLTNFKNYRSARLQFCDRINFITGANGAGKTNVLDAIHYLGLGKSYFHSSDQHSVNHDERFFRLEGKFNGSACKEIICSYQPGGKKDLQKDGVVYARIADHVGIIPIVMITPDDQLLIDEASDERRRFIDNTVSQIDHAYLEDLIEYNRILQQRNAALKQFAWKGTSDRTLIESLDIPLAERGERIHEARKKYFSDMIPLISDLYHRLSANGEAVTAEYDSVCRKVSLKKALHASYEKDVESQRTNEGIHRDDFHFFLNRRSLKKFGSQGQKKSFLLALKLSQFEVIKKEKNESPLLLLDDLFDKLDESRSARLLNLICENGFGQVFITDANVARIASSLRPSSDQTVHYKIEHGTALVMELSP